MRRGKTGDGRGGEVVGVGERSWGWGCEEAIVVGEMDRRRLNEDSETRIIPQAGHCMYVSPCNLILRKYMGTTTRSLERSRVIGGNDFRLLSYSARPSTVCVLVVVYERILLSCTW